MRDITKDKQVSKILMNNCNRENVHHGGIAIYYPGISARTQKYNLSGYMNADGLKHKIISKIFRYTNRQIRENMYTVRRSNIMRDENGSQRKSKKYSSKRKRTERV